MNNADYKRQKLEYSYSLFKARKFFKKARAIVIENNKLVKKDVLIENNIKAIWNFAPCKLKYPEDIIFIQENLALSLAHLNNQLNSKLRGKNEIR